MSGWIKLHRKIMDDPVFQNEKLLKVWLYCLLKASHKGHETMVGMQLVNVKPGEFVFGRRKASVELNMNESTLWNYMKKLESFDNIKIDSNNKFSVINVVNWGKYQDKEIQVEQQNNNNITTKNDDLTEQMLGAQESNDNKMTGQTSLVSSDTEDIESEVEQQNNNKITTDEQQRDTNKNVKNDKNVKNNNKPSESDLKDNFEKLWKLYPNKKSKPRAFQSYKKAIKDGTTNKEIQDGIIAYKKQIKILGTETQYIAHGSTWFNQKRWEDDYTVESKPSFGRRSGKHGKKETLPDWAREDYELEKEEIAEEVPEIIDWQTKREELRKIVEQRRAEE